MRSIRLAAGVAGGMLLLAAAAVEVLLLVPVLGSLYLGALALVAAAVPWRGSSRERAKGLLVLAGSFTLAAALYLVPWSSRKPFLRDLRALRPGMSEAEVRQRMHRYVEGTGWVNPFRAEASPEELTIPAALVFRHSDHPDFNSDWGIVHFAEGRVTAVEFNAD